VTTPEEALRRAADLFHEIGRSRAAEELLAQARYTTAFTEAREPSAALRSMAETLRAAVRTPAQIQELATDGFEACVRALADLGAADVTIHECRSAALSPWVDGEASEDGVSS
jgi:hypothetical protein